MADVFARNKRSAVMAAIRAKHTKPEMLVRRLLHAMGYRFRLHVSGLPGRPDIVLPKHRLIIQVKGCFWHGHYCLKGRIPGTNRTYWGPKIQGNKERDARNERRLRAGGWRVTTIWECKIRRSTSEELHLSLRRILPPNQARLSPSALRRFAKSLAALRSRRTARAVN